MLNISKVISKNKMLKSNKLIRWNAKNNGWMKNTVGNGGKMLMGSMINKNLNLSKMKIKNFDTQWSNTIKCNQMGVKWYSNNRGPSIFPNKDGKDDILKKFTIDLTEMAKKSRLDPVIGRSEEVRRTIEVLSRRRKK